MLTLQSVTLNFINKHYSHGLLILPFHLLLFASGAAGGTMPRRRTSVTSCLQLFFDENAFIFAFFKAILIQN